MQSNFLSHQRLISFLVVCLCLCRVVRGQYVIVDTGQERFFNNSQSISEPREGESFCGQDAMYYGNQPAYQNNQDGTITDLNTGLMWRKTPDLENKSTFEQAIANASTQNLAGYTDWRLPTIKELYSLILFSGETRLSAEQSVPYIQTEYFDFAYGDEEAGERFIDAQYWSSTVYAGTAMNGMAAAFGVNFADGRIKGYGIENPRRGETTHFVRYVRGNPDYGKNRFHDNGNGTITDLATGLMWQQADDGHTRNWQEALAYAEALVLADCEDWRLPDAKELQSIVDYSRAPDATDPERRGPAIDPIFDVTNEESWFWSGTTHLDGPDAGYAVYLCFGQAFGYMPDPLGGTNYMNVHGAGAQRSDPKSGDPADWPTGHGPQGDEIRIYNYVRCVRNITDASSARTGSNSTAPADFALRCNYPNPFNAATLIPFSLSRDSRIRLTVYDGLGREVICLAEGVYARGDHRVFCDLENRPSGDYIVTLVQGSSQQSKSIRLLK